MITRQTVVVVGAGASYELNLPLGTTLRQDIAALLNITFPDGYNQKSGDHSITQCLRSLAQERGHRGINDLLHKCWLIRDALPAAISIDNLLDAHRNDPDIALIGKLGIARAILNAERSSKLFREPNSGRSFPLNDVAGTWLLPMFQLLTEGVAKEDAHHIFDNVTFIVFNYDRCLQAFLHVALKAYYGFDDQKSGEIAGLAKIIHPYGRVGDLGANSSLAAVGFGAQDCNIRKVAEGIRTFSEGLMFDSHRAEIQNAISQSDQIVFLGFAFHPLNMEILSAKQDTNVTRIFGTTVGLSESAVRSIRSTICNSINKLPPTHELNEFSMGSLTEINLESRTASDFLFAHFRSLTE